MALGTWSQFPLLETQRILEKYLLPSLLGKRPSPKCWRKNTGSGWAEQRYMDRKVCKAREGSLWLMPTCLLQRRLVARQHIHPRSGRAGQLSPPWVQSIGSIRVGCILLPTIRLPPPIAMWLVVFPVGRVSFLTPSSGLHWPLLYNLLWLTGDE